MIKKVQITSINKDHNISDNTDFLDVKFDLMDEEDNVIESVSLGFDVDKDTDYIKDEVTKYLKMRQLDEENSINNTESNELNKKIDKTIVELQDLIIE